MARSAMAGSVATGNRGFKPEGRIDKRGLGVGVGKAETAEIHDYPSYLDWFSGAGGTA